MAILCFFFSTGFVPVWTDYRESKPVYTKTHTIPINRSPTNFYFAGYAAMPMLIFRAWFETPGFERTFLR